MVNKRIYTDGEEVAGPDRRHGQVKWGTDKGATHSGSESVLSPRTVDGMTTPTLVTSSTNATALVRGAVDPMALLCWRETSSAVRVLYKLASGKPLGHAFAW